MSVKFITNKTYLENVNGLKNFEEFNINYDSNRDKNKQVKASFNKNGKKYEVEDSLQKFMHNMPNSKSSIFDLLKNDLHESKKKTNNTSLSYPVKHMKLKNGNVNGNVNGNRIVSRKSSKGKYRINRGITSKLFDYDQQLLPQDYNHKIHITNKHKLKHAKKYTHRAK
jgi:hypothetical protein